MAESQKKKAAPKRFVPVKNDKVSDFFVSQHDFEYMQSQRIRETKERERAWERESKTGEVAVDAATRMAAQLEWRLQFARHVFRAELMHPNCFGSTCCGEEVDGKRMYIKTTRDHEQCSSAVNVTRGRMFVANDLDGDGVSDFQASEIVENDLDGDGFPDGADHQVAGGDSFTRRHS